MSGKRRARSANGVRLRLALQGGGAHGAFTWGVLDRLLDETDIEIAAISGASAGALNGAALACGLAADGRAGGKRQLEQLWQKVSESGSLMTLLHLPLRKPGFGVWDDALPLLSPYQTNPVALELLRYVLGSVVDIELLRGPDAPRLFVNAVNVRPLQFESLRRQGFDACAAWLEINRDALGKRSSVDIGAHYLSSSEKRLGRPPEQRRRCSPPSPRP